MRRRLLPVFTCLALLSSAGCTREPQPGTAGDEQPAKAEPAPAKPDTPPASEPTASPAAEPTLDSAVKSPTAEATANLQLPTAVLDAAKDGYELLAAGVEPLQALRFAPQVGQVETIKLTMTMTMSIVGAGMPPTVQQLPPIEQINRAETLSVGDGRIEEKIVFESFSVGDSSGNPQAATMLQSTLEQIRGFEQVMTYDDRGGVIDGELSIPDSAGPQLAQTLETMGKTFEQVMVRLPEPPVGVGAKWRETSKFDNNGIELEQTSQFELVEREGDKITLTTQITQRPLSDSFQPPGVPIGEVKLLEFDSKGGGRVTYDLHRLMPDEVATTVETKFTVEATAMGQTQKLTTEIHIELLLERLE